MDGETAVQTGETDYVYDMFDNVIARTIKTFDSGGSQTGSTAEHYVLDGSNIVLAFDASENLTDRYLFGPGVNQVLASEHFALTGSNQLPSIAGTTLWPLPDNQGTVRDLVTYNTGTDKTTLADHISYSPFGAPTSHTATDPAIRDFLFEHDGSFYDPTTGLEHDGERWYDSLIERWLTQDPTGLGPDSNPYRPFVNSPTNLVDPAGLSVGQPGLAESLLPVWGSGRAALDHFQNGNILSGLFYSALMVSDVFLLSSVWEGVGKIGVRRLPPPE